MRILLATVTLVLLAAMVLPLSSGVLGTAAVVPAFCGSVGPVGGLSGGSTPASMSEAEALVHGVEASSTSWDHRPPLTYRVDFTESGLPSGTNWSVSLTGSAESTILGILVENNSRTVTRWSNGDPTVGFQVSNGSYTYRMDTGLTGWNSYAGQVAVNGPLAEPIAVSFWLNATAHHRLSIVGYAALAGFVGLVAAVIAGVLLWFLRRPRGGGPLRASADEPDPLAVQERDS